MKKDVNKQLQNHNQTVNSEGKKPRKVDKIFVIIVCVFVFIAIFIVLFVTLSGPVYGAIQLNRAESFIEAGDISAVVLNQAAESTGILNDKEAVLRDAEANELSDRVQYMLENVKYADISVIGTGVWKTKIVMYNASEEFALYIDSEGIYIENDGRLVKYRVSDECVAEYDKLLSDVEDRLNK